jgi:formyl-CoA transferase
MRREIRRAAAARARAERGHQSLPLQGRALAHFVARFATRPDRHARSLELIRIFDEIFATRDLAEWRAILDGNGLVFGVVGILDDIPNDRQMIENEVLVPFENDTMLTVNSPIWIDGSRKVRPRHPPGIGEHSDEILREAGYDEASIRKLRASGAVA